MLDEYGEDQWGRWAEDHVEELMTVNHENVGGAKTMRETVKEARQIQERNNKRRKKNCLTPAIGLLGISGVVGVILTQVAKNLP